MRTAGAAICQGRAATWETENDTANTTPTRCVPKAGQRKGRAKATEIGAPRFSDGATTFSPSAAPSTEIAGVMTLSP